MNQLLNDSLIATENIWASFLVLRANGSVKALALSKSHPVVNLRDEDVDQVCSL